MHPSGRVSGPTPTRSPAFSERPSILDAGYADRSRFTGDRYDTKYHEFNGTQVAPVKTPYIAEAEESQFRNVRQECNNSHQIVVGFYEPQFHSFSRTARSRRPGDVHLRQTAIPAQIALIIVRASCPTIGMVGTYERVGTNNIMRTDCSDPPVCPRSTLRDDRIVKIGMSERPVQNCATPVFCTIGTNWGERRRRVPLSILGTGEALACRNWITVFGTTARDRRRSGMAPRTLTVRRVRSERTTCP